MRRFDACALCLQRVRDPVACHKGHLFCRECALTDLVSRINDIKRTKVRLEALKKEAEEERERAREAARERVLREFEKGQLGLAATSAISTSSRATDASADRGTKRKFDFDSSAVDTLTREEAALRQIEREPAEALKSKLPDFWLPPLTPTYTSHRPPTPLADVKLQTTCRGGNPPHPLACAEEPNSSQWMYDTSSKFKPAQSVESTPATEAGDQLVEPKPRAPRDDEQPPICPSCKKHLSNNTLMNLMKSCGHVTCKTCTHTLVKPAMQRIVCGLTLGETDVIELTGEGTGYAAGSLAETSKKGIAFQG